MDEKYNEQILDHARHLGSCLQRSGMQITTAESCTGGGISYMLTSIAGSSTWFDRGFVVYSNTAKQEMLGVSAEILQTYGAVSEETAMEMASGALEKSTADIAVAVTGIAGPDGGSEAKPVGTVCFAWHMRDGRSQTTSTCFQGDRQQIRSMTIDMALQGTLDILAID